MADRDVVGLLLQRRTRMRTLEDVAVISKHVMMDVVISLTSGDPPLTTLEIVSMLHTHIGALEILCPTNQAAQF